MKFRTDPDPTTLAKKIHKYCCAAFILKVMEIKFKIVGDVKLYI